MYGYAQIHPFDNETASQYADRHMQVRREQIAYRERIKPIFSRNIQVPIDYQKELDSQIRNYILEGELIDDRLDSNYYDILPDIRYIANSSAVKRGTKYPSNYVKASDMSADTIISHIASGLGVSKNIASTIYSWYDAEGAIDDYDNPGDLIDFIQDDIYDMLDAASEPERSEVAEALDIDIYEDDEF